MGWTTPADLTTGHDVTATEWNQSLGASGNTAFLYGDTAWTTVSTFSGTWVDFATGTGPVGYRKAGNTIYMRGAVKSGTINTAAFTLPSGYRPTSTRNFVCLANSALGSLTVTSAGVVTPAAGSTVWFSFDGVNFDIL